MIPLPLIFAPMVPATCVPCHWSSVGSKSSFTKSYHPDTFAERSLCVASIPVSTTQIRIGVSEF